MELIAERVSKSLKLLRKELHLSQAEAGAKLGISQQSWANWEACRSVPEQPTWTRICEVFGKDLGWFFLDHSEPVEILRGPDVAAFKAFSAMLGAMGKTTANPIPRILTGRTAKHMPAHSFLSKIKVAFG